MLNNFNAPNRIYLACGYTDLRLGIDGLAAIVRFNFNQDPMSGSLFLFCERRADRRMNS